MKRLAWVTDLHLDHAKPPACEDLWNALRSAKADALLVGGDTSTAKSLERRLKEVRDRAGLTVYFVLGNHDCYGGSIASVRAMARRVTESGEGLIWLGAAGVIPLTKTSALIGHDGWGDGGFGNATTTRVRLNDFMLIDELRIAKRPDLLRALKALGDESAAHLRRVATAAAVKHNNVITLMHVPPYREAAWYEGGVSEDNWLPFFACKAAGEALSEVVAAHQGLTMTTLCGHTHGGGRYSPMEGLTVITGPSEYGAPVLQQVLEVP